MKGKPLVKTITAVHSLRGIAALSVCLFHFVYTTTEYFTDGQRAVFYFGKFGVHLFFLISGIVIPIALIQAEYKLKYWGTFMWKRIVRIEPPYLVSLVLALVYLSLRNHVPIANQVDLSLAPRDVFLHIGYLVPFVPGARWALDLYWTLSVEFQYYLLLSILFPLVLAGRVGRYCFYALMIGISVFDRAGHDFLPQYGALFLTGIVYALYFMNRINKMEFWIVAGMSLLTVLLVLSPVIFIVVAGGLAVIMFAPMLENGVLRFFGNISYSLYLVHPITGGAVINLLSHRFRHPGEKVAIVLIGLALSIIVAYVLYLLIERATHRFARKIKYVR